MTDNRQGARSARPLAWLAGLLMAVGPLLPAPASELSWQTLRPGVSRALLQGDPATPGRFVYRIRVPAGFSAPQHAHSTMLEAQIIRGAVRFDFPGTDQSQFVRAGERVRVPAGLPHGETALIETEMQVSGIGPVITLTLGAP